MKLKTNLTIVLTLVALMLTACTGGTALADKAASAVEPVISQISSKVVHPTKAESVEVTQATQLAIDNSDPEVEPAEEILRPENWSETTHSKKVDPNYELVFPQDEVNRLDISISPENWQVMLDDMTSLYGEFGANPRRAIPGVGQLKPWMQNPPPAGNLPPIGKLLPQKEGQPPAFGNRPPGGGARMEGDASNPIWVPVTIEFEGDTWTNVGLRFKGNSSLFSSWGSGGYKLPLKLDFDEFEDEYEEIDDQRFYGFKQLTLSSNFNDGSFLREKVAADIFREAGVPAAETAFYRVYVDHGEGPLYFGLYTMVEVIDDTVIETQFEDDNGNVYKPMGAGATFAAGSFSEAAFDKETNQDEDDYSDILALFQALHAETRTSDPQTWRSGLEAVFDVPGFLQYLAVNTVIQNWDTYGVLQHNYYLYHDPATDLLTWIPWDNNMAMTASGVKPAASISLDEISQQWPLIRYLMDDPVYQSEYVNNVEAVINGVFNPQAISVRYQEFHDLIRPYVVGTEGEITGYTFLRSPAEFDKALAELIQHAESRYQAVSEYLRSVR